MTEPLRIVIADDEAPLLQDLEETLRDMGHQVVGSARTGKELVSHCADTSPDLVITDIKMPDMDGLEAANRICAARPVPIVIVSAYHDPEYIERASREHVLAYLVKPITDDNLMASITIAMGRFRELQALLTETESMKRALEERKLIERAKGILMTRAALSEPDAFRRLQDLASTKHEKMAQIARGIITADEAFQSND